MKKPANLVDKALEVARSVPKKPVKTKGRRTVPAELDWGPGVPTDKLAYLNDEEMALLQAHRMFKGKRKYKGIPAFPDPGDTAAGDTGQGTSSSAGLGNNTGGSYSSSDTRYGNSTGNSTSSAGSGTGGGSDSGAHSGLGGAGSSGGNGTTAAGGVGSTTNSGTNTSASSSASPSSAGASTSPDQSKSSGPSSGPTDSPVRTEASSAAPSASSAAAPTAASAPMGFSTPGGYNPAVDSPSTIATQSTLDRIAAGSSVIGNTTPQGYATKPIQDQVQVVDYTQQATTPYGPTVAPPDDPYTQRYAKTASYLGSVPRTPSPVGMSAPEEDLTAGANSPFADPNVGQYNRADYDLGQAYNPLSSVSAPTAPPAGATTPGSPTYSSTPSVSLSNLANPALSEAANAAFATRNTWSGLSGYGSLNTPEETAMTMPSYNAATKPDFVNSAQQATTPTTVSAASMTNPFYRTPAQQAADIRRAVALAQGQAAASQAVTPAASVTDEYDYDPAKDPVNYVPAVTPGTEDQPSYMSPEQRASYMGNLGDTRSSEHLASYAKQDGEKDVAEEETDTQRHKRHRRRYKPYEYRDYMYDDYTPLTTPPSQSIAAFNQYNQNLKRGGKVGDSVQAALRIARSKLL